ncbi:uncharacterized protein HD556DRAFT_1441030 [Suillus plorans]|uniref:Fungal-type protein kinase domain-containing protein n=1 Tax=Suillus plorans TaxID=116603 RepID=A0A9P7DL24_9AGAM|nr:uncharacterized protein HD556DRAFT_1441030 [Suillus plorans]KAG1797469.1 hypothetical protein HD556DRAFT_1441030 [Suillus plorans]
MSLGDLRHPTTGDGIAAVDAEIIPAQFAAQGSQLTPATVQQDSSAAEGNITPVLTLILAQPVALDSLATPIVNTPIKRDSSTRLPFTTLARCRVDTLNSMGKEMQNYVIGPMPVEKFLNKFLPNPEDYDTSDFASASNAEVFDMQSIKKEEDSYDRFINGIRPFAPQLSFVNSSKHADTNNCSSFTFNVKLDVCVYANGTSHGCDISKFEVNIEFKWNDIHDAFRKHPGVDQSVVSQTDKGFDTLGQITSYAVAQLGAQYRTHVFSILIIHNCACIIRWDREGAIVTNTFDYYHESHLADFFYCFARASPALCGVDTSITPASNEDAALARTALKLATTTHMLKVAVPQDPAIEDSDWLTLIIPQPVAKGFPLVGRWTCTCPAFDILNNRVVMFKDSWHVSLKDVLPEGETYKLLKSHNVRNVATCITFHDVIHATPEKNTQTVKFGSAEWACPNKAVTPHILHRLVLDLVGEQLTDFESSRELVQSVRDALLAHQDAYKNAKILHRDLSVGNIVIYRGRGFLIDWDLAKLLTIQGPRQTTRTGTWQFMSAHLVKNSFAVHAVKDDLESSLYVVLWTALKYRESYMSVIDRTQFILQIFDADPLVGTGGSAKSDWLVAGTYFPRDIFVGCKLLNNLVVKLAQFFSHRYSSVSPEAQESLVRLQLSLQEVLDEARSVCTAAQQKMIDVAQCCLLESSAYQKEIGMQILHSHEVIINIYDKHLGSSGWPDKDAAVLQKMHPTNKQSGRRLYTKSLCASQDVTSAWVQVTPSGKKRRLDPEDDIEILSSVAGLDDLVSFNQ